MATPVHGKDRILMFRKLSEAGTKGAAKLSLQTSHTWNYQRSTSTTETKDGGIVSQGGLETSLDISAVTSKDELNEMLKQAVIKSHKLEVWDIDLTTKGEAYLKTTDTDIVPDKKYYTRTGGPEPTPYVYELVSSPVKGSLESYYEEAGSYDAEYAQGNLDSWEVPSEVGDYSTTSTTMRIDGEPQSGKVILSQEQEKEIMYAFRDTDPYVET